MSTITDDSEEVLYTHGHDEQNTDHHSANQEHHDAPLFGAEDHGQHFDHDAEALQAGNHDTEAEAAAAVEAARKKKLKRNSNIVTGIGGVFIVGVLTTFAWPYVFPKQNHVAVEQEVVPKVALEEPKQTPLPVPAPIPEQLKPAPADQGNVSPAALAAQAQNNVGGKVDPINAETQAQIDRMKAKDAAFSNGAAQDNPFAAASSPASTASAASMPSASSAPSVASTGNNVANVAGNPSTPAKSQKHAPQSNDINTVAKSSDQQKHSRHTVHKVARSTKKQVSTEPREAVESAGTSAPAAISGLWVRATYPSTGTPVQAWIQDEGKLTIVRVGDMIKGARVTKLDGLTVVTTAGKINPQ